MAEFLSAFASADAREPRLAAQKPLSELLHSISSWTVYVMVAFFPLFFLPWTTQALEFPKQLLLLVGVTVATVTWFGAMLVDRQITLRRSVANLAVIAFLLAVAISAMRSPVRYVSLIGDYGQELGSLVTSVLFAFLFFVVVHGTKQKLDAARVVCITVIAGGVAALYALLQFGGVYLLPVARSASFNTVGSTVALGMFEAVIVVLAATALISERQTRGARIAIAVAGALALLTTVVIDFWPVWTAMVIGLLSVLVFSMIRPEAVKRITWLAVPMGALVVAILLLFVNIPSPLHAPTEIFPSPAASLSIVRSALATHPIFGTGPGTFAQDYARYRSTDLNHSYFWTVGFDRASSHFLTLAATTGFAGFITWILLVVVGLWKTTVRLIKKSDGDWSMLMGVTAAWITTVAASIVYSSSLALQFLFWLTFALVIGMLADRKVDLRFEASPRAALGTAFAFIVVVVLALAGWYTFGARFAADTVFARAASRDTRTELDTVIKELEQANGLNAFSDLVVRNLSQAYLLKIQAVASDTKLDKQAQTNSIVLLTDAAVRAARAAVSLSPSDAANWSQLGQVYENIAPYVGNAGDEAVKAFQQASDLDPTSPVHHTEIAKVHMSAADAANAELQAAKSEDAKAAAQKKTDDALTAANAELQKALALKGDYAPAGYQLALLLDRQGKTKDAIAKLEQVRGQASSDVGVAMQLGLLYYRDGQKDKAQNEFERAVKLVPTFANARWFLSVVYEEKGRYDDAIAQVQEILKTNPDNAAVQKRLADLQAKKSGQTVSGGEPGPLEEQPKIGQ